MPERAFVLWLGRCPPEVGCVAGRLQHKPTASFIGAVGSDGICGRALGASVAYGSLRTERARNNPEAATRGNLEPLVSSIGGNVNTGRDSLKVLCSQRGHVATVTSFGRKSWTGVPRILQQNAADTLHGHRALENLAMVAADNVLRFHPRQMRTAIGNHAVIRSFNRATTPYADSRVALDAVGQARLYKALRNGLLGLMLATLAGTLP